MKEINGNILDQCPGIICHQVNTLGKMGKGLALQIRQRWPHVYYHYKRECDAYRPSLGRVLLSEVIPGKQYVFHMFGQDSIGCGENRTAYEEYPIMLEMAGVVAQRQELPLYFPKFIGCGLAGGDWSRVAPMLEKYVPAAILVNYVNNR